MHSICYFNCCQQCICSIPFVQYFMMTHVIEILKVLDVLQKPLNFSEEWAMQFFYWSAKIGWGRIWSHCIGGTSISTSVDAKNSGATMSTEGRFNSSLLKSSGWAEKQKLALIVVGSNEGDAQRLQSAHFQVKSWQYLVSNKSWKAKLVAVALQLQLDGGEWRDNHRRWTLKGCVPTGTKVHDQRKLPSGRSWLVSSMGRVLPMPVGRQERMWCLSSSLTAALVMSACNCHIFNGFW